MTESVHVMQDPAEVRQAELYENLTDQLYRCTLAILFSAWVACLLAAILVRPAREGDRLPVGTRPGDAST